jgi:opacity protein-like surface antigen
MKRLILILFVLMIMVPMTTVMAKNTRYARDYYERDYYRDNYATIKLGAFIPDDDADFLDNGYSIEGAIGHNLSRNFAVEIGLDYTITDFKDDYGYEDAYVSTLGIPVTAKFIAPLSNQVDFFVGAGLGLYFTHVDFGYEYYDEYYYDDDNGVDDTCLGFHCLIGADVKMNSNTALTMQLKYTELDQDDDEYDHHDNFNVGGTTASLGIKFLF